VQHQAEIQASACRIEPALNAQFGWLMSTEEVAAALKMSAPALRMARSRRRILLAPVKIDGRRGQFFSTSDVARLLAAWLQQHAKENAM
jgi:hypothetical protein